MPRDGPDARTQTPPRTPHALAYPADAAALGCPDGRAFVERVGDMIGDRAPFVAGSAATVRVSFGRAGRSVRGAYAITREGTSTQPRAFTGRDCARVTDDLVRSLGIALDPMLLLRAAAAPPPPPPPPRPPAEPTEVIPVPQAHERPPPVTLGDAPLVAPVAPPRREVGVDVGVGGLLGAGGVWREAAGVAQPSPSVAPQVFAGARVAAAWPLTRAVSLYAHADTLAALVRAVPALRTDDAAQAVDAWDPPLVHAAVGVGLLLRLR